MTEEKQSWDKAEDETNRAYNAFLAIVASVLCALLSRPQRNSTVKRLVDIGQR